MESDPQELAKYSRLENEKDEDAIALEAIRITNAVAFPMVLKSALELGLIEAIYGEGNGEYTSVPEIMCRLPRKPNNVQTPALLDRVLRLLTSHSMLTCREVQKGQTTERVYSAKPICKFFVKKNQDSGFLGPKHLLCQDKLYLDMWCRLTNIIMEGEVSFEGLKGTPFYEYSKRNARINILFNEAMANHSAFVMLKVLKVYKGFEDFNVLVDVGGGNGTIANIIARKYPNVKVICFDLPHVIASASSCSGVEHVVGDMFESVSKGDAIFMKYILHNWGDDHCLKILKNCWDALPENGKVIVIENVLGAIPKNDVCSKIAADMDLLMMCFFREGKQRTLKDFENLAIKSGFRGCKHYCSIYNLRLLEFYKSANA